MLHQFGTQCIDKSQNNVTIILGEHTIYYPVYISVLIVMKVSEYLTNSLL